MPVILGPLTEIINCSILTTTFPAKWKQAEVIPILKDGDHEEAANNRSLSLLAVASKVCEKIILNQFNTYLIDNKRLTSHQRGNKKAHSTETLNIQLTDSVFEAMDKKQITALVLLDLSKAFDSIDHARLLHKLSNLEPRSRLSTGSRATYLVATTEPQHVISRRDVKTSSSSLDLRPSYFKNSLFLLF